MFRRPKPERLNAEIRFDSGIARKKAAQTQAYLLNVPRISKLSVRYQTECGEDDILCTLYIFLPLNCLVVLAMKTFPVDPDAPISARRFANTVPGTAMRLPSLLSCSWELGSASC